MEAAAKLKALGERGGRAPAKRVVALPVEGVLNRRHTERSEAERGLRRLLPVEGVLNPYNCRPPSVIRTW